MRGRKALPTHLKVLRGNPGHQRLNANEPRPEIPADVPEPPPFVIGYALDEWWRVGPQLHRLGLLTQIDVAAFAAYCIAYGEWRTAREAFNAVALDPTGALIVTPAGGGKPSRNPLLGTAHDAAREMIRYAAEFGLTPSARTRIAAGPGGEPARKFANLLAG